MYKSNATENLISRISQIRPWQVYLKSAYQLLQFVGKERITYGLQVMKSSSSHFKEFKYIKIIKIVNTKYKLKTTINNLLCICIILIYTVQVYHQRS